MSYAGSDSSDRTAVARNGDDPQVATSDRTAVAQGVSRGRMTTHDGRGRPTARGIRTLSAGITIGVFLGAAVALLLTPLSGDEARDRLAREARRLRRTATDRWEDLEDDIRFRGRRSTRHLRRRLRRSA